VLSNRVASPKELARESGESLSSVSYHVKYLREEGCIEIFDTEPRRGAIEHYYRVKAPPPHARAEVSGAAVRNLLGEVVRALNADTFDAHRDRHLSWMPMELDAEGWRELIECQAGWLEELKRVKADAAERLAVEGAAPGKRAIAGMMGFETPPGPGFADTER